MTNLCVLVYLCTVTTVRMKKEDKEELYLNILTIYYMTNRKLKKMWILFKKLYKTHLGGTI